MIVFPHRRCALFLAMVATQIVVAVVARVPIALAAEQHPFLLNDNPFATRFPDEEKVVFKVSWGTEQFPKGTVMLGTYASEAGPLWVCLKTARSPDLSRKWAEPDKCLARAVPRPDALIERLPNGLLYIPQSQPFYLLTDLIP